jgi:DNA-directed RNA polymerase subunit F
MGEVFKILSEKTSHTDIESENLAYLEKFVKVDPKKAKKVEKDIKDVIDLPENVVKKLIDLVPKSREEITSVLSSYSIVVSEKDLNTLLGYFELL